MASYSSLVKEVLPYVPFCPDSLVEQNLRSATIEFCERSKAYILDMDAFNTISGVYEYDFDRKPPSLTKLKVFTCGFSILVENIRKLWVPP